MQIKEQKIATFTTKEGKRIQILEITKINAGITTNSNGEPMTYDKYKYQIRINRKIILTTINIDKALRKMASLITGELLQTKFTF